MKSKKPHDALSLFPSHHQRLFLDVRSLVEEYESITGPKHSPNHIVPYHPLYTLKQPSKGLPLCRGEAFRPPPRKGRLHTEAADAQGERGARNSPGIPPYGEAVGLVFLTTLNRGIPRNVPEQQALNRKPSIPPNLELQMTLKTTAHERECCCWM